MSFYSSFQLNVQRSGLSIHKMDPVMHSQAHNLHASCVPFLGSVPNDFGQYLSPASLVKNSFPRAGIFKTQHQICRDCLLIDT